MKKDSKIYIAGHRGLVGSAILKNLEAKGYTNFVTRTHNELDLTNQAAVEAFFETEKPEYVILAAAKVGGIVANNTYRGQFIYENLQIQNNVIHQSYVHGINKLLFLGSTCIYPKNAPQPMTEDCLLTGELEYTNEPYAIAKIAGIKLCESYNIQYGTNFISVMPTNLYGPNDNFDLEKSHVLPALIRKIHLGKALENKDWDTIKKDLNRLPIEGVDGTMSEGEILSVLDKYGVKQHHSLEEGTENLTKRESGYHNKNNEVQIEIWGSGNPMREFLWSEDMADACVFIMENRDFKDTIIASCHPKLVEGEINEPYELGLKEIRNTHINIGTGKDVSIRQLAETIKKIIGFKGKFYYNTQKPDGTLKKLTNPSKLHNLGWKHSIELEEGVEKIYKWFCNNKLK